MDILVLIAAGITSLAVIAHVIVGTRETASLEPPTQDDARRAHWVQAMSAFQMLSVDLLAVAGLLIWIGVADVPGEAALRFGLSLLFAAWGAVWLFQMLALGHRSVSIWKLPHWAVWFLCAALLLWPVASTI